MTGGAPFAGMVSVRPANLTHLSNDVNHLRLQGGDFAGREAGLAEPGGEGGAACFELLPVQRAEGVAGDGPGVCGRARHEEGGEHGLGFGRLGSQEGLGGCRVGRVKGGSQAFLEKACAGVAGQKVDVLGRQPLACFEAAEDGMEEEADGIIWLLARAGAFVFGFRLFLAGHRGSGRHGGQKGLGGHGEARSESRGERFTGYGVGKMSGEAGEFSDQRGFGRGIVELSASRSFIERKIEIIGSALDEGAEGVGSFSADE